MDSKVMNVPRLTVTRTKECNQDKDITVKNKGFLVLKVTR